MLNLPTLQDIKKQAPQDIARAKNLAQLEQVFREHLGKNGRLTKVLRSLAGLPFQEKIKTGRQANALRDFLQGRFKQRAAELRQQDIKQIKPQKFLDFTAPGKKFELGHLHPLTQVTRQVEQIFQSMGFDIVSGPHIESEYYNFDALNIPAEHPARDLWDTFWLKRDTNIRMPACRQAGRANDANKLLLRTHTSPVQIRYMESHGPPIRVIAPGRCFRHEATDASHDAQFYQVEGLAIDRAISAANFRAVIESFFSQFFGRPVKSRLRPSYFPFTEPSFEVDIGCLNCRGRGCQACKFSGWMEMLGAGMVHPRVLENVRYDPKRWQGFAFGMGLDRLAMLKFNIPDIRLLYKSDLRMLEQF